MKSIFFTSTLLFFFVSQFSLAQNKKEYKWSCAVAINSIQAQIAAPIVTTTGRITTGAGPVIIDTDGNIITFGDRVDNSYSLSVIPKIYIKKDFAFRAELGITNLHLTGDFDIKGPISHDISNKEVNTKFFRYLSGFQWFFFQEKRIESYCGLVITYTDYNDVTVDVYQESREIKSDTIQSWLIKKEKTPGGYGIGIGALAGFNLYLNKHISVGAELSSSACYYDYGGITKGENSEQVPPNPVLNYPTSFSNSYKGYKISKILASFNVSVRF